MTSSLALTVVLSLIGSAITVGGVVVAVTRSLTGSATEFRIGIKHLVDSLERLSEAVEGGFDKVHERLDQGEKRMNHHHTRLVKVEINAGLDVGEE